MKKFVYGVAAVMTVAMLTAAAPVSAKVVHHHRAMMDCSSDAAMNDSRCYRPAPMRHWVNRERIVPVYVDDDGAPRPLPPHAARGHETPPTDAGLMGETIPVW
ncbi:MAG TPA: hypothetical protein VHB73_02505 [Alphaproteobacteria bacterium]|nr:hypothetical protein [Alphaproteobacteria bacterium]